MSIRRVVITGAGVLSPVGNTKEEFWKALVEGKSGIGSMTSFDCSSYPSRIAGEIKNFQPSTLIPPKQVKRMDKFVQYAVYCAETALKDSGLDIAQENRNRCGVLVGSGIGGLRIIEREHLVLIEKGMERVSPFLIPMLIVNMASGQIAITFGFKGPNTCVATACATGNNAIGDAFRLIQFGKADIMIAGGTESSTTPLGVAGFCQMKALSTRNDEPQKASRPFDKERDGFVMGEGCGVVILEELSHALKRKADIYAEVIGYGMSCDAYHITAPDPDASGAVLAIENVLEEAQVNAEEIDYINAHGTSTQLNDKIETLAIKKVFKEHAKKVAISSTKSMTGHLLGAAGGIETIATSLSIKEGIIPPTINYQYPDPDCDLDYVPNTARKADIEIALTNSLGFGGHNAILALRKFKK
ncbi:MAG: beta-ketoacyl-ACP synthase II [Candidatus Omnitrophota bacterium]